MRGFYEGQEDDMTEKLKCSGTWQPDLWWQHSEEFYSKIYVGGKCRYCGATIPTNLSICDCEGMRAARARFRAAISRRRPATKPAPVPDYNPDLFTEPTGGHE